MAFNVMLCCSISIRVVAKVLLCSFWVLWELRHCYPFAQCDFSVLLCDCQSIRVVARVLLCSCEDVQNRGINMHLPFVNMFCMAFSLLLCGCYSIWMVAMVLPRCHF